MPVYEYYCPKCGTKYELLRPMGRSEEPGVCPQGHRGGTRTISVFAPVAKAASEFSMPSSGGGCGCGGGACGCAN